MAARRRGDLTGSRRESLAQENRDTLVARDRKAGIVPRSNSQSGDFTGRERDRLIEEKAEEVSEAQRRVGLVSQVESVVEESGEFDALTGAVTLPPDAAEKVSDIEIEFADEGEIDAFAPRAPEPANAMRHFQDTEVKQAPQATRPNPAWIQEESEPEVIDAPTKKFRVNSDIEEMTYGRDPQTMELRVLNFVRGRWYRGPADLYDHLDRQGLIYH